MGFNLRIKSFIKSLKLLISILYLKIHNETIPQKINLLLYHGMGYNVGMNVATDRTSYQSLFDVSYTDTALVEVRKEVLTHGYDDNIRVKDVIAIIDRHLNRERQKC